MYIYIYIHTHIYIRAECARFVSLVSRLQQMFSMHTCIVLVFASFKLAPCLSSFLSFFLPLLLAVVGLGD